MTKRVEPPKAVTPVEVMEQLLAGFAVDLARDPGWQAIIGQVPRHIRRELGKRFGYMVVGVHKMEELNGTGE